MVKGCTDNVKSHPFAPGEINRAYCGVNAFKVMRLHNLGGTTVFNRPIGYFILWDFYFSYTFLKSMR